MVASSFTGRNRIRLTRSRGPNKPTASPKPGLAVVFFNRRAHFSEHGSTPIATPPSSSRRAAPPPSYESEAPAPPYPARISAGSSPPAAPRTARPTATAARQHTTGSFPADRLRDPLLDSTSVLNSFLIVQSLLTRTRPVPPQDPSKPPPAHPPTCSHRPPPPGAI